MEEEPNVDALRVISFSVRLSVELKPIFSQDQQELTLANAIY